MNDNYIEDAELFDLLEQIDKFSGDDNELLSFANSLEEIDINTFIDAATFFKLENDPIIIRSIEKIKSLKASESNLAKRISKSGKSSYEQILEVIREISSKHMSAIESEGWILSEPDTKFLTRGLAAGLAASYFYNFIEPVSNAINHKEILIYKTSTDENPVSYKSHQIKLQILMPQLLNTKTFDKCQQNISNLKRGIIAIRSNNRRYSINYFETKTGTDSQIAIVDTPLALTTVMRYYESMPWLETAENNRYWDTIQALELHNFKNTILQLFEISYPKELTSLMFEEIE